MWSGIITLLQCLLEGVNSVTRHTEAALYRLQIAHAYKCQSLGLASLDGLQQWHCSTAVSTNNILLWPHGIYNNRHHFWLIVSVTFMWYFLYVSISFSMKPKKRTFYPSDFFSPNYSKRLACRLLVLCLVKMSSVVLVPGLIWSLSGRRFACK